MKILVTGATGNLGSQIVDNLLLKVSAENIVASVRDITSDKALNFKAKGIDVRIGDFDNPDTLKTAFANVDRVFIMSTFGDLESIMRQHSNAVQAAKHAGVKQIVYPSVTRADNSDFFLASMHRAREQEIINSGISYVFLRNNWYVENELGTIQGCLSGAPWVTSAGEGNIGWVYRPDLAEAAANVLVAEGHDNKAYELSGDNLTQQQFVNTLSNVLGKQVPLLAVDDNKYSEILTGAGVPEAYIPMLVMIQKGIREGGLEATHSDLEFLLDRPATSVQEALKQLCHMI